MLEIMLDLLLAKLMKEKKKQNQYLWIYKDIALIFLLC